MKNPEPDTSILSIHEDVFYMREALKEAHKASEIGEVPVGVVIVCQNRIIARAHNLTQKLNDVTAHAEMQAITSAANHLGGKYLIGCRVFCTLEPCVMCAGALFWSQAEEVIFAADDPKRGCMKHGHMFHPKTKIQSGLLAEEASLLLRDFFKKRR